MTDEVLEALDDLVRAAAENAQWAKTVERRARVLRRERERGRPYREIVEAEEGPLLVSETTAAIRRLADAGSRFRRAEARALHAEGLSMERIAKHFGVTRQRISEILRASDGDTTPL
jgi:hypothetical protein